LTALICVEPIVALADVGGYDRRTVLDTLQWAAVGLTRDSPAARSAYRWLIGPAVGRETLALPGAEGLRSAAIVRRHPS